VQFEGASGRCCHARSSARSLISERSPRRQKRHRLDIHLSPRARRAPAPLCTYVPIHGINIQLQGGSASARRAQLVGAYVQEALDLPNARTKPSRCPRGGDQPFPHDYVHPGYGQRCAGGRTRTRVPCGASRWTACPCPATRTHLARMPPKLTLRMRELRGHRRPALLPAPAYITLGGRAVREQIEWHLPTPATVVRGERRSHAPAALLACPVAPWL
jgi:hypothetical protein